ncbi:F0F1 ATP synthase subunit A [Phreatobacter oligotrophus]|jgi:F-type H+-transporting ATPase subunit a|uniref:ATP synthase subunit a n=1 Tax=Phreatobacter oligotrophus TaxID=1122261 RepID=A0A2T4ZF98_9HYPH|nr:F0F1 ATP synthase subunit A [Phreatobacter oligotrophus]PTM60559.1 ATP synthase F0 subcomplex A subunit [Phreatobacter oligotrophus]
MADPIKQFELVHLVPLKIGGADFGFTNSSLHMFIAVGVTAAFLLLSTTGRRLVPTRMQSMAELAYEFVAGTVRQTTGKEGMKFFPLVFSLFMFVLFGNLIGMIPGAFTVTSHIIVTAALAMLVITTVIVYGIMKHGTHWFALFAPSGLPKAILPVIVVIEVISFISRPISLSLRLFGNMTAGHIALKVFAGFVTAMAGAGVLGMLGATLPVLMITALTALELLVAVLQAYVFTILTCIYLNDALHPGHH